MHTLVNSSPEEDPLPVDMILSCGIDLKVISVERHCSMTDRRDAVSCIKPQVNKICEGVPCAIARPTLAQDSWVQLPKRKVDVKHGRRWIKPQPYHDLLHVVSHILNPHSILRVEILVRDSRLIEGYRESSWQR